MINEPPPVPGLNNTIPIIIPIKGKGGHQSGVWVTPYVWVAKLCENAIQDVRQGVVLGVNMSHSLNS